MTRLRWPILLLLASCTPEQESRTADPAPRPNILFIYTDDQSHRTVGCYPEAYDWVRTPNIDRLAKRGVRFTHAYIGSWCMPSRATMLTGHHQHGVESMRMAGTYPGSEYDPDKCPFWPKIFRAKGYVTAQIGKWHTGTDAGFGRDWDHQIVWNRPKFPQNSPNYYDRQLISRDGGPATMTRGYTTDLYTDWAIEFMEGKHRAPGKPWYLWLCYGAVHGPFTPADRHLNDYPGVAIPTPKDIYPPRPGKPRYVRETAFWERGKDGQPVERHAREKPNRPVAMKDIPGRPLVDWVRQYHQGVRAIDENVGRLMTTLEKSGQLKNTLVVFTSDQGFAWGQHGFKTKVAPYDATVRAPLIVSFPGQLPEGTVVRQPVSGVDLPPTFFSWAGMELPWKMHGRDLTPLLKDPAAQWPYSAMMVHTGKRYGSDTAVVPKPGDPALYHGPGIPWYVMLAKDGFKYIRNLEEGEIEELYDLTADPEELENLALKPRHGARLKMFREETLKELRRTDAGFAGQLSEK